MCLHANQRTRISHTIRLEALEASNIDMDVFEIECHQRDSSREDFLNRTSGLQTRAIVGAGNGNRIWYTVCRGDSSVGRTISGIKLNYSELQLIEIFT